MRNESSSPLASLLFARRRFVGFATRSSCAHARFVGPSTNTRHCFAQAISGATTQKHISSELSLEGETGYASCDTFLIEFAPRSEIDSSSLNETSKAALINRRKSTQDAVARRGSCDESPQIERKFNLNLSLAEKHKSSSFAQSAVFVLLAPFLRHFSQFRRTSALFRVQCCCVFSALLLRRNWRDKKTQNDCKTNKQTNK